MQTAPSSSLPEVKDEQAKMLLDKSLACHDQLSSVCQSQGIIRGLFNHSASDASKILHLPNSSTTCFQYSLCLCNANFNEVSNKVGQAQPDWLLQSQVSLDRSRHGGNETASTFANAHFAICRVSKLPRRWSLLSHFVIDLQKPDYMTEDALQMGKSVRSRVQVVGISRAFDPLSHSRLA